MPQTKTETSDECLTRDQLPAHTRMRLDHAGEWIAWDQGMTRVVAFGSDPDAVRAEAIQAGTVRPVMDWVPAFPVRTPGDA